MPHDGPVQTQAPRSVEKSGGSEKSRGAKTV